MFAWRLLPLLGFAGDRKWSPGQSPNNPQIAEVPCIPPGRGVLFHGRPDVESSVELFGEGRVDQAARASSYLYNSHKIGLKLSSPTLDDGSTVFFNGQAEGPHGAPDRRHTRRAWRGVLQLSQRAIRGRRKQRGQGV